MHTFSIHSPCRLFFIALALGGMSLSPPIIAGEPDTTCFESIPSGFNNTLENPTYFTIIDDIAYVIDDGSRLAIIDLNAFAFFPTLADIELEFSVSSNSRITLSDDRTALYLFTGEEMHIYEISDLTDPWFVRSYPINTYGTVPTKNGRLFANRHLMIDSSRPLGPRANRYDNNSFLQGEPLFIINENTLVTSSLYGYDITDPSNPIENDINFGSTINGFSYTIDGDTVYSLNGTSIRAASIFNPEFLIDLGTVQLDLPSDPTAFTMKNSIAFLAGDQVTAYDISNFGDPVYLGQYANSTGLDHVTGLITVDGTIHSINSNNAGQGNLTAFTLTTNPLATFAPRGPTFEIKVLNDPNNPTPSGKKLALATMVNFGIGIYDISDPYNAKQIALHYTGNGIQNPDAIAVDANPTTAFVATQFTGLKIIDITDPYNPVQLSTYDPSGSTEDVRVMGNYAYVANQAHGLQILDISDPANPVVVSITETVGSGEDITLHQYNSAGMTQTLALLTAGTEPSSIIDVTNPLSPTILATVPAPTASGASTLTMTMHGNYLYTADVNSYRVFDVSDLSNPILLATHTTDLPPSDGFSGRVGSPSQIRFGPGNTLIIANGTAGLTYYNNADPLNPILDHYRLVGSEMGNPSTLLIRFEIHDNLLFAATRDGGFRIYDRFDCQTPCPIDFNHDGQANFFDITIFLNAYNTQDPLADLTNDGQYTFYDISAFFNLFTQGCP